MGFAWRGLAGAGLLTALCLSTSFVSSVVHASSTTSAGEDKPLPPTPTGTDHFAASNSSWVQDTHANCWAFFPVSAPEILNVSWSGACADHIMSGPGTLVVTTSVGTQTVSGTFLNGRINGSGWHIVTDGARLDGNFSDGLLNGDGTTVWPGGSRYQGQYVNQHFQGNGKLSWPDGDFYEGEFSGGAFHGRGKLTYADGTTFEGHFEKGQIVGEVTARMADGTRLSGVLVLPRRDADPLAAEPPPFPTAMLRLEQEAVVDIRFTVGKDGSVSDLTAIQVSGIAAIDKAANDEIARWHFQPATLNGAPIVYKLNQTFRVSRSIRPWSHGGRYEGDILNGELSGQGKVTWPGGDTYIGQFAHGHENGHGVYTAVDGRIYEGHFAGGMLSGHAVIRNPDGTRLEGDVVPPHVAAGDILPDTEYPTTAVRKNKQGTVTIRYRVGVDGTVRGAHVLYFSGTQELDDEAVAQVFRSHLTPATLNGKPIELDAIRVVKFVLQ